MRLISKKPNCFIVACFCLFLFACSPQKNTAKTIILSQEAQGQRFDQLKLYSLATWSLSGKISIRFHEITQVGELLWEQEEDHYRIILYGPAGLGGVRIEGKPGLVSVKSDQGVREADSPEALLSSLYGWDLPVSALTFWIKALPEPFEPFELKEKYHLPQELTQGGWSIQYEDYILLEDWVLPTKIKLSNNLMKIIIKVREWHPKG